MHYLILITASPSFRFIRFRLFVVHINHHNAAIMSKYEWLTWRVVRLSWLTNIVVMLSQYCQGLLRLLLLLFLFLSKFDNWLSFMIPLINRSRQYEFNEWWSHWNLVVCVSPAGYEHKHWRTRKQVEEASGGWRCGDNQLIIQAGLKYYLIIIPNNMILLHWIYLLLRQLFLSRQYNNPHFLHLTSLISHHLRVTHPLGFVHNGSFNVNIKVRSSITLIPTVLIFCPAFVFQGVILALVHTIPSSVKVLLGQQTYNA
jgi:hypothetical protein